MRSNPCTNVLSTTSQANTNYHDHTTGRQAYCTSVWLSHVGGYQPRSTDFWLHMAICNGGQCRAGTPSPSTCPARLADKLRTGCSCRWPLQTAECRWPLQTAECRCMGWVHAPEAFVQMNDNSTQLHIAARLCTAASASQLWCKHPKHSAASIEQNAFVNPTG